MENTEKKQYFSSISIMLGDYDECCSVHVGRTSLYLHGSPDDLRAFAASINEAADRLEKRND